MKIFHLDLEMFLSQRQQKKCSLDIIMNKIYCLIFFSVLIISCSEGDIIENDIDFTAQLDHCSNPEENTFVFYKIDTAINQALSLSFTSPTFQLNTVPEDFTITITLNETTNILTYRQFDSAINGEAYYCVSVPPGDITVTQELVSTNGNAVISYNEISKTDTTITYTRTITLNETTLNGDGISIRQELLELGTDEITVAIVTP